MSKSNTTKPKKLNQNGMSSANEGAEPANELKDDDGKPQSSPSDEAQAKKESSTAARKSLAASKQAKRLKDAAAGAGDPDERQKLLNQALEKEIEAETFGKTAKYLNSGAFQGMLAGTGMGGGVGAWLGLLVTGLLSAVTGGLGAGIGAGVGALHGPWFKLSDAMGAGIKKITGTIPGWKATADQKRVLEEMVHGVKETEKPGQDELEEMSKHAPSVNMGGVFGSSDKTWTESAKDMVPGWGSKKGAGEEKENADEKGQSEDMSASAAAGRPATRSKSSAAGQGPTPNKKPNPPVEQCRRRPPKLNKPASSGPPPVQQRETPHQEQSNTSSTAEPRKRPRKLEVRSEDAPVAG